MTSRAALQPRPCHPACGQVKERQKTTVRRGKQSETGVHLGTSDVQGSHASWVAGISLTVVFVCGLILLHLGEEGKSRHALQPIVLGIHPDDKQYRNEVPEEQRPSPSTDGDETLNAVQNTGVHLVVLSETPVDSYQWMPQTDRQREREGEK